MNDPIVDEVRRVRDEHAAKFNYDLDAIYRDLKEQEKKSGRTFVRYGPSAKLTTAEQFETLAPPTADGAAPHSSATS